jgi:uncharacterized coiled-coil protein SlyX
LYIYEEEERKQMATMRRVEERIDALEAEAQYKENNVGKLKNLRTSFASKQAKENPSLKAVFDHLNNLSKLEAQALLRRCCIRVAEMKEINYTNQKELQVKEEDIAKYKMEVDQVRNKLRSVVE